MSPLAPFLIKALFAPIFSNSCCWKWNQGNGWGGGGVKKLSGRGNKVGRVRVFVGLSVGRWQRPKQKTPLFPRGLELRSSQLAEKPCRSFSRGREASTTRNDPPPGETTLLTGYLLGRRKVGPSSAFPNPWAPFIPYDPKCNKICGYSVFLAPAAFFVSHRNQPGSSERSPFKRGLY